MIILNFYWFFIRFFVCFFIISLVFDIEFSFLVINFIFLHLLHGVQSILFDYIHEKRLSFFLITLFKILFIENLIQLIKFYF